MSSDFEPWRTTLAGATRTDLRSLDVSTTFWREAAEIDNDVTALASLLIVLALPEYRLAIDENGNPLVIY